MLTILMLTAFVVSVVPDRAVAADAAPDTAGYLIPADHPLLPHPDIQVVRDIGFGWLLVDMPLDLAELEIARTSTENRGTGPIAGIWPNDSYQLDVEPLFDQQWSLENTGQSGGKVDADIDITEAWGHTTGNPGIVIAVVDSGVDLDHPDLIDRLWTNTGEIPANGVDDDGNGYVDDTQGWDMVDFDAVPQDTLGHGTAVAGVAGASINDVGIAGAAPDATIMPIRVCPDKTCSLATIVEGIKYAVENGASIINLSLGSNSYHGPLDDAVSAAGDADIVVVAAAGNDGRDIDIFGPYYPASLPSPNVIAVAATDRNDDVTNWSNTGTTSVDLGAPGNDILTSVIDGWGTASGTSFSAPLVSGVAALIRDLRPLATPSDVRRIIMETVDPIASLDGNVVSGGRLNAARASERAATNAAPQALASVSPTVGWAPQLIVASGAGSTDPDGTIVTWDWTVGTIDRSGEETTFTIVTVGVHDVQLTVTDDLGASGSDTAQVWVGTDFIDTRTSIFRTDIAWLSATGVTRGCNPPVNDLYCPDRSLSRGEMAAFISRFADLPATGADFFVDDEGSIFENDINRLAAARITRGCNPPLNDRFCPDDLITRAQIAAFLVRMLDLPATGSDFFVDDEGSIFEDDINRLAAARITRGCNPPLNDRFCPDDLVTRAQVAAFFRRAGV
jgi:subtilisin family serine protease